MVPGVLAGVARKWLVDPTPRRSRLVGDLWIELKVYAARHIREIALQEIKGFDAVRVDGPVTRHSPLVVTALARLLQSDTLFEFGPDSANTVPLLAHNLPNAQIFWLDDGHAKPSTVPAAREGVYRFPRNGDWDDKTESSRITKLAGDSTTFDLLPYSGTADVVYIESSTRCDKLRADTDAAFGLLSELGCIVWDGYTGNSCVYARLNELAREFDRPVYHIRGTRLAVYSRWDIVSEIA